MANGSRIVSAARLSPLSEPVKKPKATWVKPVVDAEIEYVGIIEPYVGYRTLAHAPDYHGDRGQKARGRRLYRAAVPYFPSLDERPNATHNAGLLV